MPTPSSVARRGARCAFRTGLQTRPGQERPGACRRSHGAAQCQEHSLRNCAQKLSGNVLKPRLACAIALPSEASKLVHRPAPNAIKNRPVRENRYLAKTTGSPKPLPGAIICDS
jgi:hypothetical protein